MFSVLGALVAVLARGAIDEPGKGWFGTCRTSTDLWDRNSLPLQVGLVAWVTAHALTLSSSPGGAVRPIGLDRR